jgi:hypothetical protein
MQTTPRDQAGGCTMDDAEESKLSQFRFNPARYWDYLLGGHHNFEVDRAAGDLIIKVAPDARLGALANRSFLRRSVRFLAQKGINQFFDLGSGIPTVGNVHEVARNVNPDARTVYVDIDPVAVTHSKSILAGVPNTAVIESDFLEIDQTIQKDEFTSTIDLKKPVGVVLSSVLHFVKDDDKAYGLIKQLHSLISSQSYMVISHFSVEDAPQSTIDQLMRLSSSSSNASKSRTRKEIESFFDGFKLVDPGVVHVPSWRPEASDELLVAEPKRALSFCGVAIKD